MDENTENDLETRLCETRGEGARDFYTVKGVLLNPHPQGTPEHNEYERGWVQEQRLSGVIFKDPPCSNWWPAPDPKPYEQPKVN